MSKRIGIYNNNWGDPRRRAAMDPWNGEKELPHGLMPSDIEAINAKFESYMPGITSKYGGVNSIFDGVLPEGASFAPRANRRRADCGPLSTGGGSSGNTYLVGQGMNSYMPEFQSPDRQNFPIHRVLGNRYWRMFRKLDPVIGTCIEMISDLPWGNFQLSGEGVDGEIKDTMEFMCEETEFRSMLPYLAGEFLTTGEAIPHLFFDNDRGIWTHIALHNPDQIEVTYAPFLNMEPYLEFVPDDRLREVLTKNNDVIARIRSTMPPEILARLISRQNIPLSPINVTFLARKQHWYEERGTSIVARMWRTLMYEDALYSASIQTARRLASPLKVAKLGNPATNWIPGPEHEKKLLELIAQAEVDPGAWISYHFGVQFELVGVQERVMKIDSSAELIERNKLIALGISKSFLTGEITYASASAGLTVFLRRLKALREYFENKWIYPKFFRQISVINKWVKPTEAELSHRVRVRRSHRELLEDKRYIVPKIEWDRSLDPSVDSELINAMTALSGLGVQFSETTLMSTVNRDFEEESKKRLKDLETKQRLFKAHPELMGGAPGGDAALPPGAGGGGPPPTVPGLPAETFEGFEGGDQLVDIGTGGGAGGGPPTVDLGAAKEEESPSEVARLAKDFKAVVDGYAPDEELWDRALQDPDVRSAIDSGSLEHAWSATQDWLLDQDYPAKIIVGLQSHMNRTARRQAMQVPDDADFSFFTGNRSKKR